jgi:lipopolysaccharide heptosyltransferase II
MGRLIPRCEEKSLDANRVRVHKILVVRATSRLGDSILAMPAIWCLHKKYPTARIDFIGAPISAPLYKTLPINRQYTLTKRFPDSAWEYPLLLRSLRAAAYDLAIDVSCSHSAMGSFLVRASAARYRIGLKGKWDLWYNVKSARPPHQNKYQMLPAFLTAVGIACDVNLPFLNLTDQEKKTAKTELEGLPGFTRGKPVVGVFVGGRMSWGKKWPIENFCRVVSDLDSAGINTVTFVGPDEKKSLMFLRESFGATLPVIFEPSIRRFAAMIANCDLFVTSDSGPMHLACALGIRTVAIFLKPNFDRWAPPSTITRVIYKTEGCSAEDVVNACLQELNTTERSVKARQASETLAARHSSLTASV